MDVSDIADFFFLHFYLSNFSIFTHSQIRKLVDKNPRFSNICLFDIHLQSNTKKEMLQQADSAGRVRLRVIVRDQPREVITILPILFEKIAFTFVDIIGETRIGIKLEKLA